MKAILLCAGYGTRLQPLTNSVPKPLVKILNKTILEYNLNFLSHNGINDVFINRHYLPEEFLKIRIPSNINVTYTLEKQILGTGGGILSFQEHLKDEDFLVMNGDILTYFDLKSLIKTHKNSNSIATMVLKNNDINATPVWVDQQGCVSSIGGQRSKTDKEYMFTGIHILSPDIFEKNAHLKNKKNCVVKDYYISELSSGSKIASYILDETKDFWKEIGTMDKYLQVNYELLHDLVNYNLNDIYSDFISQEWSNLKSGERIIEMVEGIWVGDDSVIDSNATIYSPVFFGRKTVLKKGARVGPNVILGDNVVIDENTELRNSVVLDNVYIAQDLDIRNMLVADTYNHKLSKV